MSNQLNRPFVVLGGGGHAGVVIDLLQSIGCSVLGVADPSMAMGSSGPLGVSVLGDDEAVLKMAKDEIYLAMGMGSVGSTNVRAAVYEKFVSNNFIFPVLMHPGSIVSKHANIDHGSQVMAGAVVQTGARIGSNCIINTSASVDHDCEIGNCVHIAPGVVLSGGVKVGNNVHIGTGARAIQSISIGEGAIVGAGVTVLKDVPANLKIRASDNPVWNG